MYNNKVCFKYRCLLEYYIGKRAAIDDTFLDVILSEERYYNFIQELIYCTGIDTRNPKVVNKLGQYINEQIEDSKIDTSFISGDRIKFNFSVDEEVIQVTVIEQQMTEKEVDIVTDSQDTSSEYLPATIDKEFSYDTQKYEVDQFNDLLMAFGNAVRNNELGGFQVRSDAYKTYMKGTMYWCSLLAASVEEFVKIVRRDIQEDEEIKDKVNLNKVEELFRDFCRIAIPVMAEGNMFENIGTKKLGKVFIEYYNSISNYNALDMLVYDQEIGDSLLYKEFNDWWKRNSKKYCWYDTKKQLQEKERIVQNFYKANYCAENHPVLIPQVYLHFDPKSKAERKKCKFSESLIFQRMDFLMIYKGKRIIIEIDGYSHLMTNGKIDIEKYSQQLEYDRTMKFLEYDIFRICNCELEEKNFEKTLDCFFKNLYTYLGIEQNELKNVGA